MRSGYVYWIQCDGGPIKIGFSVNPEKRLRELQAANPYPLRILGTVRALKDDERDLHLRFAQHRVRGEWFAPTKAVLDGVGRPYSYSELIAGLREFQEELPCGAADDLEKMIEKFSEYEPERPDLADLAT